MRVGGLKHGVSSCRVVIGTALQSISQIWFHLTLLRLNSSHAQIALGVHAITLAAIAERD